MVRLNYERIPLPLGGRRRLLTEVRAGIAAVTSNVGVGLVVALVVLQAAIRGAFTVFVIVIAIDLLGGTQSSVGILQGAVGLGAIAGSTLCALLVGSRALTRWLGVAVVLWGAPLAIVGLLPYYTTALLAAGGHRHRKLRGRRHGVHPHREDGSQRRAGPRVRRAREPGSRLRWTRGSVGAAADRAPRAPGARCSSWVRSRPSCACCAGDGSPRPIDPLPEGPTTSCCSARCRCSAPLRCLFLSSSLMACTAHGCIRLK